MIQFLNIDSFWGRLLRTVSTAPLFAIRHFLPLTSLVVLWLLRSGNKRTSTCSLLVEPGNIQVESCNKIKEIYTAHRIMSRDKSTDKKLIRITGRISSALGTLRWYKMQFLKVVWSMVLIEREEFKIIRNNQANWGYYIAVMWNSYKVQKVNWNIGNEWKRNGSQRADEVGSSIELDLVKVFSLKALSVLKNSGFRVKWVTPKVYEVRFWTIT